MKVINLENLKTCDLSFFLGLEKYVIKRMNDDCFFIWDINKSIIIGTNQLLDSEVKVKEAKDNGFKIYRRPSGGGAILADTGCFMYTFISSYKSKDEMYNIFLSKMIKVLKKLGIDVYLSGRNDLMFLNKKFSGSAIYYENNKCILHGTFLLDTDLNLLEDILNPNEDKLKSKGIKSFKERVINLKPYLNLNKDELISYLNKNIDENIEEIYLSDTDIKEVKEYQKIFDDENNIYKKNPPFTYKFKKRFSCGEIELYINVKRGIIEDINLIGDFFQIKDLNELYKYYIGKEYKNIKEINKNIKISEYINDLNDDDYRSLF